MASIKRIKRFSRLLPLCVAVLVIFSGCGKDVSKSGDALIQQRAKLQEEALRLTAIFNYNAAGAVYEKLRAVAEPGSEQWALATFGAATAAWHSLPPSSGQIDKARELFTELTVTMDASSPYWARAHLNLARMYEMENFPGDEVAPLKAREHYYEVLNNAADPVHADEAAGRLAANAFFEYEDPEVVRAGLETLEEYLARRPQSPIGPTLWNFLGESYWRLLQDAQKSHDAFWRSEQLGSTELARRWMVYWRMAWLAQHELGEPAKAIQHYQWIIDNAPRSPRIYEARMAIQDILEDHPELRSVP